MWSGNTFNGVRAGKNDCRRDKTKKHLDLADFQTEHISEER